jgi:hypothetical protein
MRVFFIRPFGVKDGIDFDRVEAELLRPAIERVRTTEGLPIEGGTTGELVRQGNIREDMFRLLITADLVIADVSIYNANVFYELGIRHGLRHQHTVLVRERTTGDRYPFDLQTDRYFTYDARALADGVEPLSAVLRTTLAADATVRDSPVFQLLPALAPHDRAVLIPVPLDFREAVSVARGGGCRGDLRLLAHEVQGLPWESEGLRVVGDAQFSITALRGAQETFEALRRTSPDDLHANFRLGTIYQKLATEGPVEQRDERLTRSDQAIRRALDAASDRTQRAEAYSLLGSNAKTRWLADWRDAPEATRHEAALGSAHLADALHAYLSAYAEDLDSFYAGVNALALLTMQRLLAERCPEVWEAGFDDPERAKAVLGDQALCERRIGAALQLALGLDPVLPVPHDEDDHWSALTRADVVLLTSDRPRRVEAEYRKAVARAADDSFALSAVRRGLQIYEALGFLPDRVAAAMAVLDRERGRATPVAESSGPPARVVLFTGHMVDRVDRDASAARFPRTPEAERRARALILEALRAEMAQDGGVSLGIAGGACGGDILFHDVCAEMGIRTRVYLPFGVEAFQVSSVQHADAQWVERFRALCDRVPPRVLQDGKALPRWLAERPHYDVWQRVNLWMLFEALALDAKRLTLVALFNREREPDGPGGTAHLVRVASERGFKPVVLDARALLEG